jgi:Mg2+ and Co2+ transporter CorA
MAKIHGNDAYNYGFLFGLVREQLAVHESAKHKKPGMWKKARAASREAKLEKLLRKIMEKKLDSLSSSDAMSSLNDDLMFMVQDYEIWGDVDDQQASYIGDILRKWSTAGLRRN